MFFSAPDPPPHRVTASFRLNWRSARACILTRAMAVVASAETILIPEQLGFQFLAYFWHYAGIGTGIAAKTNKKGIVFRLIIPHFRDRLKES